MNTQKDLVGFMNKLCNQFGICDPMYEVESFTSREHYQADDFIRELFAYEGMDTDIQVSLFKQAQRMFIEHFGTSEIYIIQK